jgi:putative ABC transport system permease protein
MIRQTLARVLAFGYRNRVEARAFIAEALDDRIDREGWTAALSVTALCLKDIVITQWRPGGYAITARPVTATQSSRPPRSSAVEQITQDVQYGVRQLLHQPAFALAAILTMALGIGGNTAIFSVAWQAMLKPLPYPNSDRIVEVWETSLRTGGHNNSMPGKFYDLARESKSFDALAAYGARSGTASLTGAGDPEQLSVRAVTGDYFAVFGMAPLAGRTLGERDVTDGNTAAIAAYDVTGGGAAVISEGLWRRRFGARRDIVGQSMRLDGRPVAIVGVMPSAFAVEGGRVDVWTPYQLPPEAPRLAAHFLRIVGRLAPGVEPAQAAAEVTAIAARAAATYPESDAQWTQQLEQLSAARRSAPIGDGLRLLTLAAAAVLLIACANLAGLQLARGVARQREFGIRAALGASRRRIVTQLLTEGLIISLLGAAAGIAIGVWTLQLVAAVAPDAIGTAATSRPDAIVLTYAAALAIISGVAFSLAPSWRTANNATRWLRQRAETGDHRSARIRLGLVAAEIGIAVTLLISAALLVSSLSRVLRVDPGFRAEGALTFDASVPARIETYAQRRQLFDDIAAAVAALPGVTAVCAVNEIPLDAFGGMTYVPEGDTRMIGAAPRNVTAGCFDALGQRLTRGRAFAEHEPSRVAIVSESFAATAWPQQDPIGKRIHVGVPTGDMVEIVGVVSDARQQSLEFRPFPQVYEAWTEHSAFYPNRFVVRSAVPPQTLFDPLRRAVRAVDADQTVARLRTMNDVVNRSVSGRQFDLRLLASFASVALVLASIGVYGLLSQLVAQRTREIGVRLALGATPRSVVQMLLKSAGVALAIGLPLGLGGAWFAARLLRRFMFRMSATDPVIYTTVAATLTVIVLFAAWLPARRAARVDPALTLR